MRYYSNRHFERVWVRRLDKLSKILLVLILIGAVIDLLMMKGL